MGNASDPMWISLVKSEEWGKANLATRKKVTEKFLSLDKAERRKFIYGDEETEGLTLPEQYSTPPPEDTRALAAVKDIGRALPTILKSNVATGSKQGAAMAIDMGLQTAGGMGGAAISPWLMGPGEVLGGVAADRINRAVGLRDPNTVDLPFVGKVQNRKLLGPITTGDVATAAPTALIRGAGAVGKYFAGPAVQATKLADQANLENATTYGQQVEGAQRASQAAMGKVRDRTALRNEKNLAAFQKAVAKEDARYKAQIDKITSDTLLSNQERAQRYADAQRDYTNAVREHRTAAADIPAQGTAGIDPGDYRASYAASRKAVEQAGDVDVAPLREQAERLNIDLTRPVDPLNRSPMARITSVLQEAGMTNPAQASSYDAAFGAGQVTRQAVPVSVDRVIATQEALGRLVSTTEMRGGPEHGAARKLYETINNLLRRTADANPEAAKAIEAHLEAQKSFRITESMEDWNDLFKPGNNGNKLLRDGSIELSGSSIQTAYAKLKRNDKFFEGSFTPEQHARMKKALENLPRAIPSEPGPLPPTPLKPDYSGVRAKTAIPAPRTLDPDYSGVSTKWPGPKPEAVEPDIGTFPYGKFILSKILGQEITARLVGVQGSLPATGLAVALGGFGIPHWVSKALTSSPQGEQIVRNIIAGKRALSPAQLAGLETAARTLGGTPADERGN